MKTTATFYHAGCPVCVSAEHSIAAALDPSRFDVEIVHLGDQKNRVAEAESAGVKSVPPSSSTICPITSISVPISPH